MSCYQQSTIEYNQWGEKSGHTNAQYMFYSIRNGPSEMVMSRYDFSRCTNMECMFYGCTSIASVSFKGCNLSRVYNMNNMFDGCTSLKEIIVSDNTSQIFINECKKYCSNVSTSEELKRKQQEEEEQQAFNERVYESKPYKELQQEFNEFKALVITLLKNI